MKTVTSLAGVVKTLHNTAFKNCKDKTISQNDFAFNLGVVYASEFILEAVEKTQENSAKGINATALELCLDYNKAKADFDEAIKPKEQISIFDFLPEAFIDDLAKELEKRKKTNSNNTKKKED